MIPNKVLALVLVLVGSATFAENTQDAENQYLLAGEIERVSTTSQQAFSNTEIGSLSEHNPSRIFRQEMRVQSCEITARRTSVDERSGIEEILTEITFDLSRTLVPSPTVSLGEELSFEADIDESSKGIAMFELHFLPPYTPISRTQPSSIVEIERAVSSVLFSMGSISDETQARQLLALLTQYQTEFCTFAG